MSIEIDHRAGGLSERTLSIALFLKYLVLTAYGIWAAAVELPTFVALGGSTFASTWAATVAVTAALAAFGVRRSWRTGQHRLEKWSTVIFSIVFLGYSIALIIRAVNESNWDTAPLSLIPVALCILSTIRYFSLVRRASPPREKRRDDDE